MDKLPYEILFTIAVRLDAPKDLSAFGQVSSTFHAVSQDDRLWKRFCYQLYNLKPSPNDLKQSHYQVLVPYGRYLGYWKSNEPYLGGLIDVRLNLSEESIVSEQIMPTNGSPEPGQQIFFGMDDEDDEADESLLNPVYNRKKLFTIDVRSNRILCHQCEATHPELPWIKNFDTSKQYFGLSQEALPASERTSLILHDHELQENADGRDIYFIRQCGEQTVIYHPLSIAQPTSGDHHHVLSHFNGLWVGSYGGHGLELLHLEYFPEFAFPAVADADSTNVRVIPDTLVARKVSGDRNVPHGKISFAALHPIEVESGSPICYDGIGQIAHTNYRSPHFIHTKVVLLSNDAISVTWYALHHTSLFKRCKF